MSVINKYPFINSLLTSLSSDELTILNQCINGEAASPIFKTLKSWGSSVLSSSDKGIYPINLEMNGPSALTYQGYLIYNDDWCVLISYPNDNACKLTIIDITMPESGSDIKWEIVPETLTINELRSEMFDAANGSGDSGGSGLPEATKAGQVLVSGEELEPEWNDAAPVAENLTSNAISNDALYTSGPTGGLADISTGQESFLQEVKGYTIIWNQLLGSSGNYQLKTGHYYIYYNGSSYAFYGPNSTNTFYANGSRKLFDLTLMFGDNNRIPFSLSEYTEYSSNGEIPEQKYYVYNGFQRLFANVDLLNAPYDAGTIKNVSATKLIETGQNLWNENDQNMIDNGLQLLAGYRYEIYLSTDNKYISVSFDGSNWRNAQLYRYRRTDGKYVWTYKTDINVLIKSSSSDLIKFVGFVHSGNYCLTSGTNINDSRAKTTETIPAYEKHEYSFDVSNLNGLSNTLYDTKDLRKIGSVDLSTLSWTAGTGTYSATITDMKEDTATLLATNYLIADMSVSGQIITIAASASPTGTLLYELANPVETGLEPFEPILIDVNDMGSETFVQPSNTNCPVNQLSYYYQNLKDKLANLAEVEPTLYNANYASLQSLKIGSDNYRILPLGDIYAVSTNPYALAIGQGTFAYTEGISIGYTGQYGGGNDGSYAVRIGVRSQSTDYGVTIGNAAQAWGTSGIMVIGSQAYSNAIGTISIGINASASSYARYAISIGYASMNRIEESVTFDGRTLLSTWSTTTPKGGQRTLHLYDTAKIFFRNEVINEVKNTFASYTAGHFLSEYIQNNTLTLGTAGKYYLTYTDSDNYTTFTKNVVSGTATDIDKKITGVHITCKVSGTSSHSVVGLDLLLYDSTSSYGFDSCARVKVDGAITDITATIDSDGVVNITVPSGATIDEVLYNIR